MSPDGLKLPNQTPSITTSLDLQIRNVLSLLKCNFWFSPFGQLCQPLQTHTFQDLGFNLLCVVSGKRCEMESRKGHMAAMGGRSREKKGCCLQVYVEPIWVYIHCFISGRLEFTGILTISLLNST